MNKRYVSLKCNNDDEKASITDILRGGINLYLRFCLVILLLLPTLLLTASAPEYTILNTTYLTSCNSSLPAGNYQLNSDLDINKNITIASNDVAIDLNGFKITYRNPDIPAFEIKTNSNLTIRDNRSSGEVENQGYCVDIQGGSFTLLSGSLKTLTSGPCVSIESGATMNMSGGVVSSPSIPCIDNNGTLNKVGGTVLVGSSEEGAVGGIGEVNDSIPENGSITIGVDTKYPSVSYDISFPVITKFTLQRNETEDIKETPFEIKINKAQYLFDEREILISFSSDLQMKNAENDNTFPYFTIGDKICNDPSLPIELKIDNQDISTFAGVIKIDQQDIPSKGEYQAEITYTITVQDK